MTDNVNVQHIVVLPRRRKEGAVQPTKMEDWNYEAKNLSGASFTRIGKAAYLPPTPRNAAVKKPMKTQYRGFPRKAIR
jgi:hypothetical protein